MKKAAHRRYTARAFQRHVVVFVGVTVVVLLGVVYFAFSKTIITITPALRHQTLEATVTTGVASAEQPVDVAGVVLQFPVAAEQTTTATGSGTVEEGRAGGTVTIRNTSGRAQPLQAGTRLLSDSGILFRTQERVDVPAGGSATVGVLADEPGPAGDVAPTHFTIVALWPGLQSLIYGESAETFTGGKKQTAVVTQENMDTAKKAALATFDKSAREQAAAELAKRADGKGLTVVAVLHETPTATSSAQVGDTVTSFTYAVAGTTTAVAAEQAALRTILKQKLAAAVDRDRTMQSYAEGSEIMTIKEVTHDGANATLLAKAEVTTVIKAESPLFDRANLVNRNRQEILEHFGQFPEVARVDVRFSPFWVLRAPSLADHIEIKLLSPAAE